MKRTRHRRYCNACKKTKVKLMKVTFNKVSNIQYYRCRPCNSKKMRDYYHGGGAEKVKAAAARYYYSANGQKYHKAYYQKRKKALRGVQ